MNRRKRMAIFVLYNEEGRLTNDVEYLICNLMQAVNKLVIVVNGQLKEYEKVNLLADYLIIRENKGYDAGAYKAAIFDDTVYDMLMQCEELIFCNDTFYGPFISFTEILKKMETTVADFWGLNLSDNGLLTFIQSYFLFFKKKVWESGDLKIFFESMIDEDTLNFKHVLLNFERGIFSFLVNRGYKYDAFNLQRYHIYSAVDGSICYDKLPILKKKAFSDQYYVKEKILNALHYINEHYNYDIRLILEDIWERNSIVLSQNEIESHTIYIDSEKVKVAKVKKHELMEFAQKFDRIYIYGAGAYGKMVKEYVGIERIAGFIVSDGEEKTNFAGGITIYRLSEFLQNKDTPIIVALSEKNRKEVEKLLCDFRNIIYIF